MAKTSISSKKTFAKKGKATCAKNSTKGSAETRILAAIAQKATLGDKTPCRQEVCAMAGMASADSFRVTCNKMKKKGLIEHPDGKTILITPTGLEKVGPDLAELPQTNEAIQNQIKERVPNGKAQQIFDYLLDGRARTKAEIARHLGYDNEKSDSVRVFISKLSKFIDRSDGMIRLKDQLFPFGRPECTEK
jgi:uncharacterized protein YjhX (UPF0386 family)